jgi:hypothetical protein
MSKEILILTPIGRIKWLKAPNTLGEVLFHLSKTFKVPEMAILLKDQQSALEQNDANYQAAVESDAELVWIFSVDEVMKKILEAAPYDPSAVFGQQKQEVFDFQQKPEASVDLLGLNKEPDPPRRNNEQKEALVRSNSRVTRGKTGKTGKTGSDDPRLAEGMKVLKDYGFTDPNKCRNALIKANFNVEQALNDLFDS